MKFSIRDLLLVTVIVALAVGWGVDRSRLQKQLTDESVRHRLEALQWEMHPSPRIAIPGLDRDKSFQTLLDSLPNSTAPAPNRTRN